MEYRDGDERRVFPLSRDLAHFTEVSEEPAAVLLAPEAVPDGWRDVLRWPLRPAPLWGQWMDA